MAKNSPVSEMNEARRKARQRRRQQLMIIRTAIVLGIVALLVLVGWLVVWKFRADGANARRETTTFFPVKEIVVEGETRYSAEELIEKSGLRCLVHQIAALSIEITCLDDTHRLVLRDGDAAAVAQAPAQTQRP